MLFDSRHGREAPIAEDRLSRASMVAARNKRKTPLSCEQRRAGRYAFADTDVYKQKSTIHPTPLLPPSEHHQRKLGIPLRRTYPLQLASSLKEKKYNPFSVPDPSSISQVFRDNTDRLQTIRAINTYCWHYHLMPSTHGRSN